MGLQERPIVSDVADGGKYFEHEYEKFFLKAYVPANDLDGATNNYGFQAPLLLVFEEHRQSRDEAIAFAKETRLANIAATFDSSVLFIYPTDKDGWKNQTDELYAAVIKEIKMDPNYADGIVSITNFFTREFQGYFVRGAIFRADIYSYGASADYVAKNLLKTVKGEYLWGPGDITPAMCSMQNLSEAVRPERSDIGILSVGNSDAVNAVFSECTNLLIKKEADYQKDFYSFVRKFRMWCNNMQYEPDYEAMNMVEEASSVVVKTSPNNRGAFKDTKEHKVGYFAYYNKGIFDNGPVPLVMAFHGGGDSSMYFTYTTNWYEIAHDNNFLYVAIENHQNVAASEVIEIIEHLKKKYKIDEHRIYATGFSMGSGKTWEMYQEFPQVFAAVAPMSALFPVKNNPFAPDLGNRLNKTVPVPMFYAGGEKSHLPELCFQADSALERIQYLAEVNQFKKKFDNIKFEEKDNWENPIWGITGDRTEVIHDDSRDSDLTIQYFESEDGVIRTALGSVSGQGHECRHHSCVNAWKFMSQFTR